MLKINKSILIICIVSLFLITGQVAASDNDLMEIDDSNANSDSVELDKMTISAGSFDKDKGDCSSDLISYEDQMEEIMPNGKDINPDNMEEEYPLDIMEEPKDMTGIVIANDNYSCGPASLATVLNDYGLNLSLNEVSQHAKATENGTSMQSLIDAAKYYNFSALGVSIDSSILKENFIAHMNINGCQHWTVIRKITETHVFLADSTEGNVNLTLDEFNSYFTQKAIVISNIDETLFKEQIISNKMNILDKDKCSNIIGKGLKKKIVGYKIVWKYGWIQKYGWVLRPVVKGGQVHFSQWKYVKGHYAVWGRYKAKVPVYKYYFVNDEALTSAKIKNIKK